MKDKNRPPIPNHRLIRKTWTLWGCFVDEGRTEKRRPDFAGEVSKTLTRRIRKLMGGNVELSYPVLGPDDFVIASMKEQVKQHSGRKLRGTIEGGADTTIRAVFEGLKLDPRTATQRIRPADVARARALTAWLWVESMGRSQTTIADGFRLSTSAVGKMLKSLRESGPTKSEERVLNGVVEKLTKGNSEGKQKVKSVSKETKPCVMVLKRKR